MHPKLTEAFDRDSAGLDRDAAAAHPAGLHALQDPISHLHGCEARHAEAAHGNKSIGVRVDSANRKKRREK
jgi:hypothetical protein